MTVTPESTGDQWRRLSVLIGVSFIDMLGFFLILPLLPFYALEYKATPEAIGWLIASFSIAQLVAAPLWGRVSDRYGRRPALLIGLSASAIAFLVFGLARSLPLLFVSRLVQGAGGGTTAVSQAYVSDSVAPADRARALGWLSAATAAGVMLGPAVGSMATHLGHSAPGFLAAALCFVNVLAAWKWLPESRRADARPTVRKPVWHAAVQVLKHPGGRAEKLIWVYSIGMLAFALFTSVLALWLNARFGITEKSIGWFFVATGAMSLVMRSVVLGPVVRRYGELGAIRLGTIVVAIGMLLFVAAPSVWWFALLLPALPIGTALIFPSTTSLLSSAAAPSELGATMGVAQTFAGVARIVAPVAGTIAYQRLGVDAPFLLGGGVMMVVGWVVWRRLAGRGAEDGAAEIAAGRSA